MSYEIIFETKKNNIINNSLINNELKFYNEFDYVIIINENQKINLVIGVIANYDWIIIEHFYVPFIKAKFENYECIIIVTKKIHRKK